MLAGEGKRGDRRGVRPMREAERKRNFLSRKEREEHWREEEEKAFEE